MFERFTEEARRSLHLASQLASERGDAAITPHHLLAGLADPSAGLSSELLAGVGIDTAAVLASMPGPPGGPGPARPPFTGPAKKALELSLREALNLAHNHIGSGHLVLGLLRLGPGEAPSILPADEGYSAATRKVVAERSVGARLGGRRRPRRTGRVIEAPTAHELAKAAAAREAEPVPAPSDEEAAIRSATEEGTRLQRALASLGVTTEELQEALSEVAADPVDDGPVELDLGAGTTLSVAAGPRAADLRALVLAAEHVVFVEGPDGCLRAEAPALGNAVWATVEGWLTA